MGCSSSYHFWKHEITLLSLPQWQSHCSRKDNLKHEYSPKGLSSAQMYRLYMCMSLKLISLLWMNGYNMIANEELNFIIEFDYPWSGTCQICDELKMVIHPQASRMSYVYSHSSLNFNWEQVMGIRHFEKTHKIQIGYGSPRHYYSRMYLFLHWCIPPCSIYASV